MTDTIHPELDARRGHDIGDYVDLIWANAADAAPRSRPSDRARSGLAASRFDRLLRKDDQ